MKIDPDLARRQKLVELVEAVNQVLDEHVLPKTAAAGVFLDDIVRRALDVRTDRIED